MQLMPVSGALLKEFEESRSGSSHEDSATITEDSLISPHPHSHPKLSAACAHFGRVFSPPSPVPPPAPVAQALNHILLNNSNSLSPRNVPSLPPRFTVVLGGEIRLDKFRALDRLIDMVRE